MLAGATGRDAFAAPALALLRAEGVDLALVAPSDAPTGMALIHVDARGENAITVVAGANALARAAQVPESALRRCSLLMMQLETPAAESLALARRAHALGKPVVLNAAPALPLEASWPEMLDVLVVNEHEAATLAPAFGVPAEPRAFAQAVARHRGITVVVTLGAAGAYAVARGETHAVPVLPITPLDTVGAGDAFVGALAAALDRGDPLRRALACAAAAGGLACTAPGAQAALPHAPDILHHAATLESRIVSERLPS
jgi:ribokinase